MNRANLSDLGRSRCMAVGHDPGSPLVYGYTAAMRRQARERRTASGAAVRLTPTRSVQGASSRAGTCLARQRIGSQLELHDLARIALTALHVERRARADRGPDASALPA